MPKKITTLVQGGLGNQLFCYAAARSYSLHHDRRCVLDNHTGYVNDQYEREYRLSNFHLHEEIEEDKPEKGIIARISKYLPIKYRTLVKEKHIGDTDLFSVNFSQSNIYFEGYWQSEGHFKPIKHLLIQELKMKHALSNSDKTVKDNIRTTNSVFVHIRRSDYSHKLPIYYYEKAINHMKENLDSPTFFVFSDDMEWAKSQSIFTKNCEFVDHNGDKDELYDFMLMKSCNHAIIANSSFSWWAAWLNDNDEQKVVCPDHSGFGLQMAEGWKQIKVKY